MKPQTSAFVLGCAVLLATAALPARAQSLTGAMEHLGPFTDDLAVYEVRPGGEHAIVENGLVVAPLSDSSPDLIEQLERENLALEFRVGMLQTQVELLSRRLASLEKTLPPAEATAKRNR